MGFDKRIRDAADFINATLGIVKLSVELLDRLEECLRGDGFGFSGNEVRMQRMSRR